MKKILYMCLNALLIFSCTTEVDDVFGESDQERLSARMDECRSLLTSAPNGWLIRYFPAVTQEFGGYNYVAEFASNGFVKVYAEIAADFGYDVSETVTSHYSLNSSSSVMLTFDTYNKYLHYFSDPDFYGSNLFNGEFEFAYSGGDANQLVFKGEKSGNTFVFTAIPEGQSGVEILRNIIEKKKSIEELFFTNFRWEDNTGNTFQMQLDEQYNIFSYSEAGTYGSIQNKISFIYTSTGIEFYEPVTFGNTTVQRFDWDASQKRYSSVDATNSSGASASIVLTGSKSDSFIAYNDLIGQWKFYVEGGSSYVNVVISEKVRGKTLLMTGLGYDVELNYHKSGSYITLLMQLLDGNSVYLCGWDENLGYYTWGSSVGFNFRLNHLSSATELIASDNGMWDGYTVSGLLIVDINTNSFLEYLPLITKLSK